MDNNSVYVVVLRNLGQTGHWVVKNTHPDVIYPGHSRHVRTVGDAHPGFNIGGWVFFYTKGWDFWSGQWY